MNNNRILIIDDDKELLVTYQNILQPKALEEFTALRAYTRQATTPAEADTTVFAVDTTHQGLLGVEMVREAVEKKRSYAVAFIDMRMPPGIHGLETARRIRKFDDNITIIIVTAYSDQSVDEIQDSLEHDVIYMKKPLSKEEVLQLARNACTGWDMIDHLRQESGELRTRNNSLDLNRTYLLDIVSSFPEGIMICSPAGTLRFFNSAAREMMQCGVAELSGRNILEILPTMELEALLSEIVEKNIRIRHRRMVLKTALMTDLAVLVSGSVLCDVHGEVHSVLLVLNNVAEFRKSLFSEFFP